jgi:transposase-like protein
MGRRKYGPEEIVAKLRQVDALLTQGTPVKEAVRSIGVAEITYYRWRQAYGGLTSDQMTRLKVLETENARLRQTVSDLTLDKMILAEAAKGKF